MSEALADLLGWIPKSDSLRRTISRAWANASDLGHRTVSLEHLLLALTDDPDATVVLQASHVPISQLRDEVAYYLGQLPDRFPPGVVASPVAADELGSIFDYASAAAEQSGRNRIDGAIAMAALIGEGKSAAANFLRVHGLTFEAAIATLQHLAAQPRNRTPEPLRPVESPAVAAPDMSRPEPRRPNARHDEPNRPASNLANTARPPTRPPEPMASGYGAIHSAPAEARREPERPHQPATRRQDPSAAFRPAASQQPAAQHAGPQTESDAPMPRPNGNPDRPPFDRPAQYPDHINGAHRPAPVHPAAPRSQRPPHHGPEQQGGQHTQHAPRTPADSTDGTHRQPPRRGQSSGGAPGQMPRPARMPLAAPHGAPQGRTIPPPADHRAPVQGPERGKDQLPPADPRRATNPDRSAGPNPAHAQNAADSVRGQRPPQPARRGPPPAQPHPPPQPSRKTTQQAAPHAFPEADGPRPSGELAETGMFVENIPRRMRQHQPMLVEIRIARDELQAMINEKKSLETRRHARQRRNEAPLQDVHDTEALSLRIRATEQGAATIDALSPETQWLDEMLGALQDDMASWRFALTPRRNGILTLQIRATARVAASDGFSADIALGDETIAVQVRPDFAALLRRWSILVAVAAMGAAAGYFAGPLLYLLGLR